MANGISAEAVAEYIVEWQCSKCDYTTYEADAIERHIQEHRDAAEVVFMPKVGDPFESLPKPIRMLTSEYYDKRAVEFLRSQLTPIVVEHGATISFLSNLAPN